MGGCRKGYGELGALYCTRRSLVPSTCFQPTVGMPRFMNEMISRSPNGANMGKPWERADLFFLKDSLERGMSLAEVAGFLGRTADEVREKVEQVTRPQPRRGPRLV